MHILKSILDLIFPQVEYISKLESLSPDEFLLKVKPFIELPSENTGRSLHKRTIPILSLFNYKEELVHQALWEVKYKGNTVIADILAALLYDHMIEYLADRQLFDAFLHPILIPIPSSRERVRERGWSQTEILADSLQKKDKNRSFVVLKNILIKKIHTESQTKLSKSERLKNLKGCFKVAKPECVKNRNIILLDDVTTTGSTIFECAETLNQAGARKIIGLTIAH
jgi:competence protein ComFC